MYPHTQAQCVTAAVWRTAFIQLVRVNPAAPPTAHPSVWPFHSVLISLQTRPAQKQKKAKKILDTSSVQTVSLWIFYKTNWDNHWGFSFFFFWTELSLPLVSSNVHWKPLNAAQCGHNEDGAASAPAFLWQLSRVLHQQRLLPGDSCRTPPAGFLCLGDGGGWSQHTTWAVDAQVKKSSIWRGTGSPTWKCLRLLPFSLSAASFQAARHPSVYECLCWTPNKSSTHSVEAKITTVNEI